MTSKEYQAIKSPQIAHQESVKQAVDSWVDTEEEEDSLPF
jgi:hypothetical protein